MENLEGYSTPIGLTPSDNWNYNKLEGRYLKISISKCRIFLLFFRVAQIAEIEVYGCDKTDQIPILDENHIFNEDDQLKLEISKAEKKLSNSSVFQRNVPSTPGKPVITFHH